MFQIVDSFSSFKQGDAHGSTTEILTECRKTDKKQFNGFLTWWDRSDKIYGGQH
jgi:hypothetical protein